MNRCHALSRMWAVDLVDERVTLHLRLDHRTMYSVLSVTRGSRWLERALRDHVAIDAR